MVQKSTLQAVLDNGNSAADNGSMVRIDVFRTENKYVFVPIYVKDTVEDVLPNKYCVQRKSYKDWPEVNEADFLFSLHSRDMIRIQHEKGFTAFYNGENKGPEKIKDFYGYFMGADIATGQINVISHDNSYFGKSIGVASLLALEKYSVDYFGNYHKVMEKKRQTFKRKKGKQNGISQHLHRESSTVEHTQ